MKLCDIADAYHATGGGIRTYLDAKRRYVRDRTAHEHALIVPADRDFHERDGRLEVFGVRSPIIPGSAPYRIILRQGRLAGILDRLRPDVIELANPYMQPRAARSLRARYDAVTAGFYHTDFPEAYVEATLRGAVGPRAAGAARRIAERYAGFVHGELDLTVVASVAVREKLEALGVPQVKWVPLGVDLDLFHPAARDPEWRRENGIPLSDTVLIYAGRMDREKRADLLVEMMGHPSLAHGYALVLMGRGPQWERLRRAAARDPRIHVLPYETDRARLARALATSDVYVSAARFETFGLSVIEAQACGLPVVGVNAGAMIDRVPPEAGELVDAPDPRLLALSVTGMSGSRRRSMGENGRKLAGAKHSWESTFARLFDLFEKQLEAGRTHAGQPA